MAMSRMMRAALVALMTIFLGVTLAPAEAEAKRRGGSSSSTKRDSNGRIIPVVIPISRGSTDIVHIADLPSGFEKDGEQTNLGWKYDLFGGGEWVFVNKTMTGYYTLHQDKISAILPMLGVSEADVPHRGPDWTTLALMGVVGLAILLWSFRGQIFGGASQAAGKRVRANTTGGGNMLDRMPGDLANHPALRQAPRAAAARAPAAPAARGGGFGKRRAA